MRVVDFFSGIGGFSLGLERAGFKTVAFSEIDPYACAVLERDWPEVPNLGDIAGLSIGDVPQAELYCGGFPCQPWSVAGKGKGTRDPRHLWPEMLRLISIGKPRWFVGENVSGIGRYLNTICEDLEAETYGVLPLEIPAASFGALHKRDRVWIIALRSDAVGSRWKGSWQKPKENGKSIQSWDEFERLLRAELRVAVPAGAFGRVSDGIPHRLHRLRCLGNSIYPPIATWIGERIKEVEMSRNGGES